MRSLLIVLFALALAGAAVQNPTGNVRPTSADDFFRHPQNAKKYNELWGYQFVFDNGTKAFVNFSWMFLPQQGNKIGCDLSFWNFKGKSFSVGRQYPTERFKEDKGRSRISIKEEYLMENLPGKGHRVLFTADKGGKFFLDLVFTEAVAGSVPGTGVFDVNGKKHGLYMHIPYGRVKGRIGYQGDTIEVQGYASMDHTWQTDQATELGERSLAFATPSSKQFFAGRIGVTKSGETFGYSIYGNAGNTQVVFAKSVLEGTAPYKSTEGFPKNLTLQWNNADVPNLQFDASKRQQKFSILSNFDGWLEKKAAKFMMGGELLFIRGRSQSSLGNAIDWIFTGF